MASFNVYFHGMILDCIGAVSLLAAEKKAAAIYGDDGQCVVAKLGAKVQNAKAQQLSLERKLANPEFDAEVKVVMDDAELTGAARKRSGDCVLFTNWNAGASWGVSLLVEGEGFTELLKGATRDEARDFMRNYKVAA